METKLTFRFSPCPNHKILFVGTGMVGPLRSLATPHHPDPISYLKYG